MQREIIITADGSTTIHLPKWDEQYHSKHGAIQEAYHVFIKHGLHYWCDSVDYVIAQNNISILEIGFGTGLNALITLLESEKINLSINYTGIEAYPIEKQEVKLLNYVAMLKEEDRQDLFYQMHESAWEQAHRLTPNFSLTKRQLKFSEITDKDTYDLIYFDAFGPRVQPELWTTSIFKTMFDTLKSNGVLVTYSAKGSVRRAMQSVDFKVERLPGPPGKREMLRGIKS